MKKLFDKWILPIYLLIIISTSYGNHDGSDDGGGALIYLSPGIQIGFNGKYFYGLQLSFGYIDDIRSQTSVSPSICYGYKKYFYEKNNKKYIDLQILLHNAIDPYDDFMSKPPLGFGLGKIYSKDNSSFRIKGYTCFLGCYTYDYEIKNNKHNYSLIPVLPIPFE